MWTGATIRTTGLARTVFNVLIIFSVTIGIAHRVIVVTVDHTLLVDEFAVIHTTDVVWVLLEITAGAELARTIVACCEKVDRQR